MGDVGEGLPGHGAGARVVKVRWGRGRLDRFGSYAAPEGGRAPAPFRLAAGLCLPARAAAGARGAVVCRGPRGVGGAQLQNCRSALRGSSVRVHSLSMRMVARRVVS